MSAPSLIPYAGRDPREQPVVWVGGRLRRKALHLFREGLRTDQIALELSAAESEVANALADALDRERAAS